MSLSSTQNISQTRSSALTHFTSHSKNNAKLGMEKGKAPCLMVKDPWVIGLYHTISKIGKGPCLDVKDPIGYGFVSRCHQNRSGSKERPLVLWLRALGS